MVDICLLTFIVHVNNSENISLYPSSQPSEINLLLISIKALKNFKKIIRQVHVFIKYSNHIKVIIRMQLRPVIILTMVKIDYSKFKVSNYCVRFNLFF